MITRLTNSFHYYQFRTAQTVMLLITIIIDIGFIINCFAPNSSITYKVPIIFFIIINILIPVFFLTKKVSYDDENIFLNSKAVPFKNIHKLTIMVPFFCIFALIIYRTKNKKISVAFLFIEYRLTAERFKLFKQKIFQRMKSD